MKRLSGFSFGGLLSRTQISLIVMSLLLLIALGSMAVLAYININTASAFQAGYIIADLVHVQREISRLHMETNQLIWNTSNNFEKVTYIRSKLDEYITITLTDAASNARVTEVLQEILSLLEQYDFHLRRLQVDPTLQQYESAAVQITNVLQELDDNIQSIYGDEEAIFYRNISDALRMQRTTQAMTIGIGGLVLLIGVLLVRSISQTLSGEFERTYHQLETEVQERRRAEEVLRRQNEYLEALHVTSLALMNRLELPDLLERIVARAAQLLGTEHGYVYLIDPEHQAIQRRVGVGLFGYSIGLRLKRGEGLAGKVWESGHPLAVNDYEHWSHRITSEPDAAALRAVMGAPLTSGQQVVGVIGIAYDISSGRTFDESEVELLNGFAQLASIALDNAQLFTQADKRMRQIEALYRADEELYRHLELGQVLQALVDVAVDILAVEKSAFLVWDEHTQRLTARACRGFKPDTLEGLTFGAENSLAVHVVLTGIPTAVEDTHSNTRVNPIMVQTEGIRAFMHIPIIINERPFGIFNVSYTSVHAFNNDEQRLFLALAQRTARAIENAYLYEQAQQAATLEERQRLARELHDAVTQTLFSASIIADVLPRLWEINEDESRRRLAELRELTRGALAEMRTLLLELRPNAMIDTPLQDLLHQLGEATTGRARLPVHILASDDNESMPLDVKVAFYRIAQEALNNVAKHANASCVKVELHVATDSGVEMHIDDDGIGFDPHQRMPDNLGLCIMRERADSVGAHLDITSQRGAGTSIHVTWRQQISPTAERTQPTQTHHPHTP